jgi:hypothetical protein
MTHVQTCMFVNVQISALYIHTHAYTYIYMHAYVSFGNHMSLHDVCMYVCMYVCVYVIRIETHPHKDGLYKRGHIIVYIWHMKSSPRTHVCIHTHTNMYACRTTRTSCIHKNVFMAICVYMYLDTHTYRERERERCTRTHMHACMHKYLRHP